MFGFFLSKSVLRGDKGTIILSNNGSSVGYFDNAKPAVEEAPSRLAVLGRYVITPEIFRILDHTEPGRGGEIQLTDALKVLARQQDMYAYDFIGRRYDVGDKQGYLEAQVEFALRRDDLKEKFKEYLSTIV